MDSLVIGYLSLAAIGVLIYAGVHIAIALSLVSLAGVWAMTGQLNLATSFVALAATDSIADYTFGVVPLFVLMGLAVSESGLGRDTFAVVSRLTTRIKGGLGVATVLSNAIFAAITGISIASAAVFSKVAVPEMIRSGYDKRLAVGVVAGSSVLGMLIPPSLLLILYAILTDTSIGDLFLGGVGPGLLLAAAYCAYIVGVAILKPERVAVPSPAHDGRHVDARKRLLIPVILLAGTVLGGIYTGYFTPTEAGAVGAALALLIAFGMRRLDGRSSWRIAVQTGHVTAAVCFLIIGASIYGRMLSFSGVPASLTAWVVESGIGTFGFLVLFSLVLIALGTILDSSSILLVTVPLAFPITQQLGVDPVHFGLIAVIAVEIGLLTPPLGLSVYVVHSTLRDSGVKLGDVFRGALPFAAVMVAVLALVIVFPPIVLAIVGR
ncbi:MAG: TRAP transporter large permease [Rhizobiaceae bacterium]|nr:TRAP transporter large permease [Rhizobiaceae bacterium]MCV0406989.1 TRAP transporter large permease [Rhizobiaceae bacterium]